MSKKKNMATTNYWFKRKRYGWGWVPASWQGWLAIILFISLLLVSTSQLDKTASSDEMIKFTLVLVAAIAGLIVLSALTGPSPKWRWGKKASDDPREDA